MKLGLFFVFFSILLSYSFAEDSNQIFIDVENDTRAETQTHYTDPSDIRGSNNSQYFDAQQAYPVLESINFVFPNANNNIDLLSKSNYLSIDANTFNNSVDFNLDFANLFSDINAILPRDGNVGGVGSTNYLAKWLDANTLKSSIIYESANQLGILTSSPTALLDINRGANSTIAVNILGGAVGVDILRLQRRTGAYVDFNFSGSGGNSVLTMATATEAFALGVNDGRNIFKITPSNLDNNVGLIIEKTSGDIGIGGDVSPDANLEVLGTMMVSSTETDNGDRFIVLSDGNVGIRDTTPQGLLDVSGGKLIVNSDGNVGIGLTKPNDLLHLYGANAIEIIQTGSTTTGAEASLKFKVTPNQDDNFHYAGIIAQRRSDAFLDLHLATRNTGGSVTAANARLTVLSDGNIGIGTTTPDNLFSIAPATTIWPQFNIGRETFREGIWIGAPSAEDNEGAFSIGAEFNMSSTQIQAWFARAAAASAIYSDNGDLIFYTNSSLTSGQQYTPTRRLTILNTGEVGIGNDSTPDYNLEVGGTFAVSSTSGANADRFIVASDGNVGINTIVPQFKLEITGSANNPSDTNFGGSLGIHQSSSGYYLAMDAVGGVNPRGWIQMRFNNSPSTNAPLSLQPNGGNVGIGTLSPANALNLVSGDFNLSNGRICNDQNCYTLFDLNIDTSGSGSPAGNNGFVQFNDSGSFGGDGNLFWDNTTKRLGLGTQIPANTFNIFGDINSTSSILGVGVRDNISWIMGQKNVANLSKGYNAGGFGGGATPDSGIDRNENYYTFDLNTVHNKARGFTGAVFDGRYVYFVPNNNGVAHGLVTRYDTSSPLDSNSSYSVFDLSTVNTNAVGFRDAVFDGRYVYFVPNQNNGGGLVVRYDSRGAFDSNSSYSVFDLTTTNFFARGFVGGIFDGRYVYFVPQYNSFDWDGIFVRYDTTKSFDSNSSYSVKDLNIIHNGARGFRGAVFDGRYVYLVPYSTAVGQHGIFVRYDTTVSFDSNSSYSVFDLTQRNVGAKGFAGGVFDGRFIYLAPFVNGTASGLLVRYDTKDPDGFNNIASYTNVALTALVSTRARGFQGAVFDGRYVYFVPNNNTVDGVNGVFLRYDTSQAFDKNASYRIKDMALVHSGAKGFVGGIFDGRYVYFVPNNNGSTHGIFVRHEAWGAGLDVPSSLYKLTFNKDFFIDGNANNIGINSFGADGFKLDINGSTKVSGDLNVSGDCTVLASSAPCRNGEVNINGNPASRMLYVLTEDVNATGTTDEYILVQGQDPKGVGDARIPAYYLHKGEVLRIHGEGLYSTPLTGATATVRIKMKNSVENRTLASASTTSLLSNATDQPFSFDFYIVVRSQSLGTATVLGQGLLKYSVGAGVYAFDDLVGGTQSILATEANDLNITVQWSDSAAKASLKIATIEYLG